MDKDFRLIAGNNLVYRDPFRATIGTTQRIKGFYGPFK